MTFTEIAWFSAWILNVAVAYWNWNNARENYKNAVINEQNAKDNAHSARWLMRAREK